MADVDKPRELLQWPSNELEPAKPVAYLLTARQCKCSFEFSNYCQVLNVPYALTDFTQISCELLPNVATVSELCPFLSHNPSPLP